MSDMYDPGSQAVLAMAQAFAEGDPGQLTLAQMNTIAYALRALHPSKEWSAGFMACAYLSAGHYDRYVTERNKVLEKIG